MIIEIILRRSRNEIFGFGFAEEKGEYYEKIFNDDFMLHFIRGNACRYGVRRDKQ